MTLAIARIDKVAALTLRNESKLCVLLSKFRRFRWAMETCLRRGTHSYKHIIDLQNMLNVCMFVHSVYVANTHEIEAQTHTAPALVPISTD